MSSRKNDYGHDVLDYIDVEDSHQHIVSCRQEIKALDDRIKDLEDYVDKLNKINKTLRNQLMIEALGLTEQN
jgi:predicted RNase H-like nuclease (RuvC/YqgF family)